jgi:hippurate hydrolase
VVRGRGSHAAMPHEGVDPVLAGAHIITALQSLVSRNAPPHEVLTIGVTKMQGADAYHVIPEEAAFAGSVRYFDGGLRTLAEGNLRRLTSHVAQAFGAEALLDYRQNYPPTRNSRDEAGHAGTVAAAVAGVSEVRRDLPPSMAGEDFAFMLNERPGAYVWMGQDDAQHSAKLHHSTYDFNDAAIPFGIGYWLKLVERTLGD